MTIDGIAFTVAFRATLEQERELLPMLRAADEAWKVYTMARTLQERRTAAAAYRLANEAYFAQYRAWESALAAERALCPFG